MIGLIERMLRNTTGNIELRRGVFNLQTGKYDFTGRIFTRDLKQVEEYVRSGTGDVFHGVNTRRPGATSGKKEDVYEITCIVGDVDFKTTPPEKFEKTLREFRHPPTILVDSGNGRHPYWFLKSPILLNGDAKQVDLIEGIGRGLGKVFGGDSVHDISRVLRTPGRRNSKYPDNRICRIISPDGPEYEFEDLMANAEEGTSTHGERIHLGETPGELPQRFKELLAKNRKIQATWNGERPDLNDQSGSGYDMAMAAILAGFGFTPEEIVCILRLMASGKGKEASQQYLEHTISKAFASMNGDGRADDSEHAQQAENENDEDPSQEKSEEVLPSINVSDKDLRRVTEAAWGALLKANKPPSLFRHGSLPVRIERDDNGTPIIREITQDRMRHHLARSADWYRLNDSRRIAAQPPIPVVRDVLATPDMPLPIITRIVEVPIFAPDGTLVTNPGYNDSSRTYYAPADGFSIPDVPERPTEAHIGQARDLITLDLLGDFPFTNDSEGAHAVALLLLPFVRDLINGSTPLHLIEKPSPGTGAGLLVDVLTFPALGCSAPVMTEARNEDEWRKRITAKLREGPTFILLDNIRLRLESSALSAAITSAIWEDRILGHSEMVRMPVRCGWIATGNNPAFSTEIASRIIRIRLDAKMDRPWQRDGFRHPDLRKWEISQRANLVWAALTFVRAWLATGCPKAKDTPTHGRFESWAEVIGGILHVAGIGGFLSNLADLYEVSDTEGSTWRAFVAAWWDRFENREIGVSELWNLISDLDEPLDLGQGNEKSQKTRLGKLLVRMRDRQFDNMRIVQAGERQRAKLWRLLNTTTKDPWD